MATHCKSARFSGQMRKLPMIYSTFTTALPGRPRDIGCAFRRIAFPLDPRTPEPLVKMLERLEKRR